MRYGMRMIACEQRFIHLQANHTRSFHHVWFGFILNNFEYNLTMVVATFCDMMGKRCHSVWDRDIVTLHLLPWTRVKDHHLNAIHHVDFSEFHVRSKTGRDLNDNFNGFRAEHVLMAFTSKIQIQSGWSKFQFYESQSSMITMFSCLRFLALTCSTNFICSWYGMASHLTRIKSFEALLSDSTNSA